MAEVADGGGGSNGCGERCINCIPVQRNINTGEASPTGTVAAMITQDFTYNRLHVCASCLRCCSLAQSVCTRAIEECASQASMRGLGDLCDAHTSALIYSSGGSVMFMHR
jgi:hypothetical protein